jgi:hypothetical protein
MPCGPSMRPFGGLNSVSRSPNPETSLPVLPLGAWYSGDCQAEPPAFVLKAEAVNAKMEKVKAVIKGAPFLIRVSTNRDIHFVLLAIMADGTVVVQPTNKGSFLKAGEAVTLGPKGADEFRIGDIVTGKPRATEYFVLFASQTELPAPTIVKSRHASTQACQRELRFPLSRFFFDPDAKKAGFDPSRVLRAVVPITVTAE